MRKLVSIVAVAAVVAAGFPSTPAMAQNPVIPASTAPAPPPSTEFISIINSFPDGGEPLKQAISDWIVQHPDYAATLAAYLQAEPLMTPEQKQAVVGGLSDGLTRLGVVAQTSSGINPMLLALLIGAGGAAAVGIAALGKNSGCSGGSVSPSC